MESGHLKFVVEYKAMLGLDKMPSGQARNLQGDEGWIVHVTHTV